MLSDHAAHARRCVIILRDVTRQVELERESEQAKKMEALGQLSGGVAHDFNNMLSVVRGYADMLMLRLANEPKHQTLLDGIFQAVDRAAEMTQRLLAFSRRQAIEPVELDLDAVIASVEPMLHRLLGETIGLRIEAGVGLDTIRADPGQLELVLMNLAINGRDAMPQGGELLIQTSNATMDESLAAAMSRSTGDPCVRMTLCDRGSGVPEGLSDRIFEPFFTTKPTGKGTGLGLSTVLGVVTQHGGTIRVRNRTAGGTAFDVFLPVADGQIQETGPDEVEETHGGSETILLAEDDRNVLAVARGLLEDAGYEVLVARDGEEALQVFREAAPAIDLLLFDVVMPRLAGPQVLEQIRKIRSDLPCVLISGYAPEPSLSTFADDQSVSFLQKPFDREKLLRVVRRKLGPAQRK